MLKKLMVTTLAVGVLAACGTPNPSGPGNKEPVEDKIKEDYEEEAPMDNNDMNEDNLNREQTDDRINPDDDTDNLGPDDENNPDDATNNLGPDNENNPDRNTVR